MLTTNIRDLKDKDQIKDIQSKLNTLGENLDVDGIVGPKTIEAWKNFKKREYLLDEELVGSGSLRILNERTVNIQDKVLIRVDQVKAVWGRTPSANLFRDLVSCLNTYQINTKPRICHFLAQTGHESAGGYWLLELASGTAYEGRRDLGNTQKGDGVKFKGAGVLQCTGRNNYQKLANKVNDPKVMELGAKYVAEKYPVTSAGVWWEDNRMNQFIDGGATVEQVSRRVNGGTNGLQDRIFRYNKALKVI